MTVGELIAALQQLDCPSDTPVYVRDWDGIWEPLRAVDLDKTRVDLSAY
jgi:hypothetical protein